MGKGRKDAKPVKTDAWEDLCTKGALTTGTAVTGNVATTLGGQNGLPGATALGLLIKGAQKIKLKDMKKGMAFSWKLAAVAKDELAVSKTGDFDQTDKPGSSGCFENFVWPRDFSGENTRALMIRQNVAPCARCRTGYKEWAKRDGLTIVVSSDEGYDKTADNAVFIFGPQGSVHVF
jgi:hypothetical protein